MIDSFRKMIAAATALSLVATPALADGLVDNVNGMTMDAKGNVIHFTGIVIGRDGKVVKLLQSGDKRPDRPDWLSIPLFSLLRLVGGEPGPEDAQ